MITANTSNSIPTIYLFPNLDQIDVGKNSSVSPQGGFNFVTVTPGYLFDNNALNMKTFCFWPMSHSISFSYFSYHVVVLGLFCFLASDKCTSFEDLAWPREVYIFSIVYNSSCIILINMLDGMNTIGLRVENTLV